LSDNAKPAPGESRTPGRRARAATSAWGRADLARRVSRLPIPEESRARVARFVEDEIERARAAWAVDAAPLDGLACPKCDKPIEDELRKQRREDEIVATLRALGATELPQEELEKILEQSRAPAPRAGS
jgi:hypothetical protein